MTQEIKIQAFPQMNPNVCNFVLEEPIESFGIFNFNHQGAATESELARGLFNIEGVARITVMGNTITVTKSSDETWPVIGKQVGSAIRTAFASGKALISETLKNKSTEEKELQSKVNKIFAEKINPSLASHGGNIELWDVKKNDIYVKMGGGCQGCASSKATLREGVDNALREEIPTLENIHDTTDHEAGENPYY